MILCFTIYILDNEFNAGLTSILKYNKSTTKEKNKQKNNNNSNKKKTTPTATTKTNKYALLNYCD